jgi:hypothetical protein
MLHTFLVILERISDVCATLHDAPCRGIDVLAGIDAAWLRRCLGRLFRRHPGVRFWRALLRHHPRDETDPARVGIDELTGGTSSFVHGPIIFASREQPPSQDQVDVSSVKPKRLSSAAIRKSQAGKFQTATGAHTEHCGDHRHLDPPNVSKKS